MRGFFSHKAFPFSLSLLFEHLNLFVFEMGVNYSLCTHPLLRHTYKNKSIFSIYNERAKLGSSCSWNHRKFQVRAFKEYYFHFWWKLLMNLLDNKMLRAYRKGNVIVSNKTLNRYTQQNQLFFGRVGQTTTGKAGRLAETQNNQWFSMLWTSWVSLSTVGKWLSAARCHSRSSRAINFTSEKPQKLFHSQI